MAGGRSKIKSKRLELQSQHKEQIQQIVFSNLYDQYLKIFNKNFETNKNKLADLFKELEKLTKDSKTELSFRTRAYKMFLDKKTNSFQIRAIRGYGDNYKKNAERVFHIITEILDIIRGTPLKLQVLNMNTGYFLEVDESKSNSYYFKSDYGNQMNYSLTELSKIAKEEEENAKDERTVQKFKVGESFQKHYKNFEKILMENVRETEKKNKKGEPYKSINEGHITEAFMRHLYWQHPDFRKEISSDDTNYFSEDLNNPMMRQQMYIALYYSIGSDAWWTGGDIGLFQIKGDNRKLASSFSVRVVASKLLSLYNAKKNKLDMKSFIEIFTRDQRAELTNPGDVTEEVLEIVKEGLAPRYNSKIEF